MNGKYAMAGMEHRGSMDRVYKMPPGTVLKLEREPNNRVDPNAIRVIHEGEHIAYIRAIQARKLAPLMDAEGKTEIEARFRFKSHPSVVVGPGWDA